MEERRRGDCDEDDDDESGSNDTPTCTEIADLVETSDLSTMSSTLSGVLSDRDTFLTRSLKESVASGGELTVLDPKIERCNVFVKQVISCNSFSVAHELRTDGTLTTLSLE